MIELAEIKRTWEEEYEIPDEMVTRLIAEVERLQKFADDMGRTANGAFLDGRKNAEGEFEAERARLYEDLTAEQSLRAAAEGESERLSRRVSNLLAQRAKRIATIEGLRQNLADAGLACRQQQDRAILAEGEVERLKGASNHKWAYEQPCALCGTPMWSDEPIAEGGVHGTCAVACKKGMVAAAGMLEDEITTVSVYPTANEARAAHGLKVTAVAKILSAASEPANIPKAKYCQRCAGMGRVDNGGPCPVCKPISYGSRQFFPHEPDAMPASEPAKVPEVCVWIATHWARKYPEKWAEMSCGKIIAWYEGMKFCPYCGKTISVREGA